MSLELGQGGGISIEHGATPPTPQTPITSDIDYAGYKETNVGNIIQGTLGPELTVNGTFLTGITSWNRGGAAGAWTWNSGAHAYHFSATAIAWTWQTLVPSAGYYTYSFTVSNYSGSGSLQMYLGNTSVTVTGNGTYTNTLLNTATGSQNIEMYAYVNSGTLTFDITNISWKLYVITGNIRSNIGYFNTLNTLGMGSDLYMLHHDLYMGYNPTNNTGGAIHMDNGLITDAYYGTIYQSGQFYQNGYDVMDIGGLYNYLTGNGYLQYESEPGFYSWFNGGYVSLSAIYGFGGGNYIDFSGTSNSYYNLSFDGSGNTYAANYSFAQEFIPAGGGYIGSSGGYLQWDGYNIMDSTGSLYGNSLIMGGYSLYPYGTSLIWNGNYVIDASSIGSFLPQINSYNMLQADLDGNNIYNLVDMNKLIFLSSSNSNIIGGQGYPITGGYDSGGKYLIDFGQNIITGTNGIYDGTGYGSGSPATGYLSVDPVHRLLNATNGTTKEVDYTGTYNSAASLSFDSTGNSYFTKGINSTSIQTTAGNANFSQPFQGASYKKVIIYLSALTGAQSYTFPTAFSHTPAIISTNGLGAAVVTALSTSACTVTGAASTGFLFLEGY